MPSQNAITAPWRAMCRAAIWLALFLSFAALPVPAGAHSWYPWECCSERDCFPVPAGDVKVIKGGWMLADGTVILHHEARPSPDGQFHMCRHNDGKGAMIRKDSGPSCFWAPINGS